MNVLVVEPGMAPYEKEINGLEEMRATVGGMITAICPYEEQAALVRNIDAADMGLLFNRSIAGGHDGVFGTFLICGLSEGPTGENQGYVIRQSVLFDNGRGFVLGEHPRAGFVTWQFTEEQGHRDYYWGHYYSDRAAAEQDYTNRAADYQRQYRVDGIEQPDFCSLTPEQVEHFKKKFHQAEILIALNGNTPITRKVEPRHATPPEPPRRPPKTPGR